MFYLYSFKRYNCKKTIFFSQEKVVRDPCFRINITIILDESDSSDEEEEAEDME